MINPEQKIHEMRERAREYGVAVDNSGKLAEYKKIVKCRLKKNCAGKSDAAAETEALAHPDYAQAVENASQAEGLKEELRWHLKACEYELEVWRTKQASLRAERKSYGA